MNIGKSIKEYRNKNNLTQAEFGKIIGVKKQTISKWESGKCEPTSDMTFEIAQAIGIPVTDILNETLNEEENMPFIYTHQRRYNVGLNALYSCIHDYNSLCLFVDAIEATHILIEPSSKIVGFMLFNKTIYDDDSHNRAIPIKSIMWNGDVIEVELDDDTLIFSPQRVARVEKIDSFNNESYGFNLHMGDSKNTFIQIIIGFKNDIIVE